VVQLETTDTANLSGKFIQQPVLVKGTDQFRVAQGTIVITAGIPII
jgi:hypothetical protein